MPAGHVVVELQLLLGTMPVPGAVASQVVTTLQLNGVAISDPITFYKGKKIKFWLPLERGHLLVRTPALSVYASVFPGPREDLQWFDRFLIKFPGSRKIIEVGVKRDSNNENNTASRCHRTFC
jgi:hypothetical protein